MTTAVAPEVLATGATALVGWTALAGRPRAFTTVVAAPCWPAAA